MNRYATVVAFNSTSQVLSRLEATIEAADNLADWLERDRHVEAQQASRIAYDLRRIHERMRAMRRSLRDDRILEEGE